MLEYGAPESIFGELTGVEKSYITINNDDESWTSTKKLNGCVVLIVREISEKPRHHLFHIHPEQVLHPSKLPKLLLKDLAAKNCDFRLITTSNSLYHEKDIRIALAKVNVKFNSMVSMNVDCNKDKHVTIHYNPSKDSLWSYSKGKGYVNHKSFTQNNDKHVTIHCNPSKVSLWSYSEETEHVNHKSFPQITGVIKKLINAQEALPIRRKNIIGRMFSSAKHLQARVNFVKQLNQINNSTTDYDSKLKSISRVTAEYLTTLSHGRSVRYLAATLVSVKGMRRPLTGRQLRGEWNKKFNTEELMVDIKKLAAGTSNATLNY